MNKMTFEKFDRDITDICLNVKRDFMDWGNVMYMANRNVPDGRVDDLIAHLNMGIGYLNDVRTALYQMAAYQKGYNKGLEESNA